MLLILLMLTWPGLVAIAIAFHSPARREDAVDERDGGQADRAGAQRSVRRARAQRSVRRARHGLRRKVSSR